MDAQVQNAIEIAWNPSSDQSLKAQAFDFLNRLREDTSAWQVCLSIFGRTPRAPEVVRHVALEIVNHAVEKGQMDDQSLAFLRDNLMDYIRRIYGPLGRKEDVDTITIQNKLTQTVTYLFQHLYATSWSSFFDDFLSLTMQEGASASNNAPGVLLYLRVINSVHDEIADVLLPRTAEEQRKDNDLKDLVRERDVQKVVRSWQDILTEWRDRDAGAVDLCLRAVGRWVNWIDVSLVVNEQLLSILFQLVGYGRAVSGNPTEGNVRDTAIDTFTEIVGKKMKPEDKINMIIYLNVGEVITQLIASPPLHDLRATSSYDTDLAEAVARLANSTAFDIIKALDSESLTGQARQRANELLQNFLPYVLRFFSDEYDEICSTVIPSLTDLLTYLRKEVKAKGSLSPEFAAMLAPILNAIIVKTKYDETSSWGSEDEQTDEAEFQELRKRLQVLQQAVAAVDESLYIDMISNLVGTTFEKYQQGSGQLNWRDLDLALHEMFLFGDIVVKSGGLYSKIKPISTAAERLVGMMLRMVDSDIASFSHPAVQLQYMEICVRYSSFFEHHNSYVPGVLENFVRLVHHNHIKVKTRSWYLFHRFAKHLRSQIGNIAQTVIEAVSDLLPIKAELPQEGSEEENMSSDENDQSADAAFSSQLYLYEAIGCICSTAAVPLDRQVFYVRSILNPLFADLETHLQPARNGDERAKLQIHHIIMALGTLARGFSDWSPGSNTSSSSAPANEISEEFARAAEAILVALESLNSSSDVRTAARFAFSRLIGVLGARILAQLPRWIDGLLSQSSTKDEMAMFLRLLDQVVYGFKSEIFQILDTLLTPFLQRVFVGISEPTAGTDDEIQLAELKREFLNFLLVILNNDLTSVLVSSANQQTFENVISLIEMFVKDITDSPTAKLAFSVLIRMSVVWGGPDVVPQTPTTSLPASTASPQPALPGFDRFMLTRFSPFCWVLPTTTGFNPKDAQAKQVLAEAASLQKTIYFKQGQEYINWLRDVELPGMGMGPDTVQEYLRALASLDLKAFRQFFQAFVQSSGG